MKHADTGRFNVVALYGFTPGQNLYVTGSHWHATYIPQNSLRYRSWRGRRRWGWRSMSAVN